MKALRLRRWMLALIVLATAWGCAFLDLFGSTVPPAPQTLLEPTRTATPLPPVPTTTPAPQPTSYPCPSRQYLRPPERTGDSQAYLKELEAFLDAGGDPEDVSLAPEEYVLTGDLTGDSAPEIVVVVVEPESSPLLPESRMAVFTCVLGRIEPLYDYDPGEWYGLELIAIEDLTQDGVGDLIFSDISCGAHTCWHTPYVWSWTGTDFSNAVGAAYQYPYPTFSVLGDVLRVVSGGIGSVGAGPQRPITTTLAWRSGEVAVIEETVGPPAYRFHALIDGDAAFAEGDLAQARLLYLRVLDDETLIAWGAYTTPEEEHKWLRAFARWRLMVLGAYSGTAHDVTAHHAALLGELEPGMAGYPVLGLADRYMRSYSRNSSAQGACGYATDAGEAEALLGFLNGFGYANPVFEMADLCPYHGADGGH